MPDGCTLNCAGGPKMEICGVKRAEIPRARPELHNILAVRFPTLLQPAQDSQE
jgi:hypothetical protein